MSMIDPTYIRTIYDGLLLGTLHKDNASALPMGLVGMYEEALPPASNVNERKKFLDFFSVWALLRKEVSVTFLIPLLEGWSEETIIYYINKYSKWFNSPQSGKYVLYHERLRAFILQKISKNHFNACNETIIKVSNDALSRRSGDEWENYALEYLSNHMLIPAIEKGDGSVLKLLSYNTTHWNRQVQISKGFEWSKRMLNDMMLWASKYDEDEVIECALNKVDLYHQEQNDAPRIVELVAQNDTETALQRIEAFGGNDKEGLQRKFILYMLCLMELTLLDSKDKPFRKEAIEKLLRHLDENLPSDHSLLNWNDFFPSYLMFQMACEWSELGLDYLLVYKKTILFNSPHNGNIDWIENIEVISSIGFEVVNSLIARIEREDYKEKFLNKINKIETTTDNLIKLNISNLSVTEKKADLEMSKDEMINLKNEIEKIEDTYEKILGLIDLGYKLFVKETEIDFNHYIKKIVEEINKLEDEDDMILKSYSYSDLAGLLNKFGKIKESNECLFKAMAVIPLINVFERHEAYTAVSKEVILECKCYLLDFIHRHVLETAHELADDWFDYIGTTQEEMIKSVLFDLRREENYTKINDIILNQDYINKLELFNQYVFTPSCLTSDLAKMKINLLNSITLKINLEEKNKNKNLEEIAYCFIKTEETEKSNSIAISIYDPYLITQVFVRIAIEKIQNDELDFIDSFAQNIIYNDEKFEYYGKIVEYLISINYDINKIKIYLEKMSDLVSKKLNNDHFLKQLIRFYKKIHEYTCAYDISQKIWDVTDMNIAMKSIASELERQGRIEEALECAKDIDSEFTKSNVLKNISTLPSLQVNKVDLHYNLKEMLSFESLKISAIKAIFGELSNRNFYLNDLNTLQLGLQKFALSQLFFENLPEERIQRFNRTLNMQWAIEIKNSISAN